MSNISVGSFPVGVAVDPSAGNVYVTNFGSGTVSVISEATGTVTATIGGVGAPYGVAADPSTGNVYVADNADGKVSVISPPDTDLPVAQQDIIVDATSPAGATVTYTPAVSDPDDAVIPAATCTPPSGSTFAIGTATVTCQVSDADDTPSTAGTSFTVTVLGAAAQLKLLAARVQNEGPGTSLPAIITQARNDLAAGNVTAACGTLTAFTQEAAAQSGVSLTQQQASQLTASAQQLQNVLDC